MINLVKEGIILNKTELEFENEGVLNPAVIQEGESIYLFYRAVKTANYSSIGYCRLDGPLKVAERHNHPLIVSEFEYKSHGVEDPRIVKIDGLYHGPANECIAVASLSISELLNELLKHKV